MACAPGGRAAYARKSGWWDAYYVLVYLTTLALVGLSSESVAERAIAGAAVAGAAAWYAAVGRKARARDGSGRWGNLFLVGLVALFALAESQDPASAWALFAVCPQSFMAAPLGYASAAVVVLNVTPVAFLADPGRRANGSAIFTLAVAVTGAASSVAFGTWITRIIRQSAERAQLIEQLRAAQAELAQVSHRAGTLAERQRLAGEIHDTLAQGLTSIVMLLQAAEAEMAADPGEARRHVGLAAQAAREGLAEARAMVAALMPAHLAASTLPEALRRLTGRVGAELGIDTRFEVQGAARALPATVEVVLLRVGQEALANVRKHSAAGHVRVALSYEDEATRLDVTDDGAGFDPGRVNGGYGLRGMRGRILAAGGSFDVRAQPGAGTALTVEVPG